MFYLLLKDYVMYAVILFILHLLSDMLDCTLVRYARAGFLALGRIRR